MDWLNIIQAVFRNLIISVIVVITWKTAYYYTSKNPGRSYYWKALGIVTALGAILFLMEYGEMGPLDFGISHKQMEYVLISVFTILIPAFCGVYDANQKTIDKEN